MRASFSPVCIIFFLFEEMQHSVYQFLFMFFPSGFFFVGEKFIALYNSSYMYLASVFGNRPQVSEKESFFSIDVLRFPYVVFLLFYYPPLH